MNAKLKLLTAMLIWGSLGLFVKNIPLSSPELAFFRAVLGATLLLVVGLAVRQRVCLLYTSRCV